MYADDTVLMYASENLQTLFESMNSNMLRLDCWLVQNQLAVNAAKTEYMLFQSNKTVHGEVGDLYFQNRILKKVETYNNLGLIVVFKLSFADHVDRLKRALVPYIFAIRRLRSCLTTKALCNIYHAFFMSRVLYLNPIWSCAPGYKIAEICRTKHKFIKAIKNLPALTPTVQLYNLNNPSLITHIQFQEIFFIYNFCQFRSDRGQPDPPLSYSSS
jgi:hypothetical protein